MSMSVSASPTIARDSVTLALVYIHAYVCIFYVYVYVYVSVCVSRASAATTIVRDSVTIFNAAFEGPLRGAGKCSDDGI